MIVAGSPIVHPGPVRKTQFGISLIRTRIHGNCMMISRKRQVQIVYPAASIVQRGTQTESQRERKANQVQEPGGIMQQLGGNMRSKCRACIRCFERSPPKKYTIA